MSLCVNPNCPKPENPDSILFCQSCGSELVLAKRYRVTRLLSPKGNFGKIYEVSDTGTPKVLKVLTSDRPQAVELFQQEAQALSQINHPGIPKGEGNFIFFPRNSKTPLHCLVMSQIEGINLADYQKQRQNRPPDQKLALEWLSQLAGILHAAHQQNLYHWNIKATKIVLKPDGQLVLTDFSAVWQVAATGAVGSNKVGFYTAGYTPPEQQKGSPVPQSDFYALGRTFVYLLTGRQPTDPAIYNSSTDELRWRNLAPNILPALADLIDKLMAPAVKDRPASAGVILRQLAEIEESLNSSQTVSAPAQPRVPVPAQPRVPAPAQPRVPVPAQPLPAFQIPSIPSISPPASWGISAGEWGFWWQWVLATVLGNLAGWPSGLVVALVLSLRAGNTWAYAALFGLPGVGVGIMQWVILRQIVKKAGWWVLANVAGSAVFGALFAVGNLDLSGAGDWAKFGALMGVCFGIAQWLVLRQIVGSAGWWVLVSLALNTAGLAVLGAGLTGLRNIVLAVMLTVVMAAIFAGVTGGVLVWLLRRSVPEAVK
jgi:serine/threonine protein kinase